MNKSDEINELAKALSKAQGEMKCAIKGELNPFFTSRYADLATVWEVAKKPMENNGLSLTQTTCYRDGQLILETTLLHSSGQWCSGEMPVLYGKKDNPQQMGSGITYARRYAMSAILGITAEDDDAEKAMNRNSQQKKQYENNKPLSVFEQFLLTMKKAKETLDEDIYYEVLNLNGFNHANEVKNEVDQKRITEDLKRRYIENRRENVV